LRGRVTKTHSQGKRLHRSQGPGAHQGHTQGHQTRRKLTLPHSVLKTIHPNQTAQFFV
jgi:hypothetical protein